jgi:hypothetical protein
VQLDHPQLDAAEFLEHLADAEAGEGREVNADAFRQRAKEVKALQRERQELTDHNQTLQLTLDRVQAALSNAA